MFRLLFCVIWARHFEYIATKAHCIKFVIQFSFLNLDHAISILQYFFFIHTHMKYFNMNWNMRLNIFDGLLYAYTDHKRMQVLTFSYLWIWCGMSNYANCNGTHNKSNGEKKKLVFFLRIYIANCLEDIVNSVPMLAFFPNRETRLRMDWLELHWSPVVTEHQFHPVFIFHWISFAATTRNHKNYLNINDNLKSSCWWLLISVYCFLIFFFFCWLLLKTRHTLRG